jgi:hypothetical protein
LEALDAKGLLKWDETFLDTPLRDCFHLGSTVINDYGRPYQYGVNNHSGSSGSEVS